VRYLVVLTVTEAKKFIAKTLVRKSDKFKRAFDQGRVVLHPSTSTVFIYEELMGRMPDGMNFIGAIAPKGTCISKQFEVIAAERKKSFDQKHVTYSWIFNKGEQLQNLTLDECLAKLGPGDFYVKGVNVIDPDGKAGVLIANPDGGTIARATVSSKKRGFEMILLATMHKLIPGSLSEAVRVMGVKKLDGAMGVLPGLFLVKGTLLNEPNAFEWNGVKGIPVAAGGIGEAEGAGVFVLEGEKAKVEACLQLVHECKGAKLDGLVFADCEDCRYDKCSGCGWGLHPRRGGAAK
jgi:hypothetical protein